MRNHDDLKNFKIESLGANLKIMSHDPKHQTMVIWYHDKTTILLIYSK